MSEIDPNELGHHGAAKLNAMRLGAVWGGTGVAKYLEAIGIHSWSDAAAFLAAMYTLYLFAKEAWTHRDKPAQFVRWVRGWFK